MYNLDNFICNFPTNLIYNHFLQIKINLIFFFLKIKEILYFISISNLYKMIKITV